MKKMVQRIEILVINLYSRFISAPLQYVFKGGCRFEPTCSKYSIMAINKYGPIKGLFLSIMRFLQCNPLSRHPRSFPLM